MSAEMENNSENRSEMDSFNITLDGVDYGSLGTEHRTENAENAMTLWVQLAWTVLFGSMILIAAGGNCIVIWIVVAHRRMRSVTNYFLVNLSVADLLLTTLNCTFNFTYMIQRNWPFGGWYCTISNFIANATVAASVFTLTGISCDRYLAIVHPLQPRMSKTCSIVTIGLIWAASFIFALPCLLFSSTIVTRHNGRETTGCILIWPDGKIVGSKFDFMYQMMFLIITYLVPIVLMTLCYSIMGKVLWGSRSIGELTQRQLDSIRSKRKVVKMFILIVFIFGICWLPYHAYFIYIYYDPNVIYSRYTQHVYLAFYWCAMSNAMVNPLIYYWMNARFRQYFRTAVCLWSTCRNDAMDVEDSPHGKRNSYSKSAANGQPKPKDDPKSADTKIHLQRQATTITRVNVDDFKKRSRKTRREKDCDSYSENRVKVDHKYYLIKWQKIDNSKKSTEIE